MYSLKLNALSFEEMRAGTSCSFEAQFDVEGFSFMLFLYLCLDELDVQSKIKSSTLQRRDASGCSFQDQSDQSDLKSIEI